MSSFETIKQKLHSFITRFYINELIKGAILFFAFGLLYFIATLAIEYMLWLNPSFRTLLFWGFVAVELFLFLKFIVRPLAQLLRLQKGLDYKRASLIIGSHFPEVNDKLLNVLQLNQNGTASDLLIASIEQKSKDLKPIPFQRAVNFKSNLKYTKYAVIPVLILVITFLTGQDNWFNSSYERVVNYQTAYEPPAPFEFFVVNESLEAIENQTYNLKVSTLGRVVPENVQIRYNNQTYFLQSLGNGQFQFNFSRLNKDLTFELFANEVTSKSYTLSVLNVPSLEEFEMSLDYPDYTNKKDEVVNSSGSATIPEGTKVNWRVKAKSTTEVNIYSKDTLVFQKNKDKSFEARKQVFSNFDYDLVTSNSKLPDYERLAYSLRVVKDANPELSLKSEIDSLEQDNLYFFGQVSDDYGLYKLNLVYYPISNPENLSKVNIPVSNSNYDEFITAFPDALELIEGQAYELYFEVFDNDELNGFKSTKSSVFSFRKLSREEKEQEQLKQQNKTIKSMGETFEKLQAQDKQLEEFSKTQKEKEALNFNDRKKFESFLKRQKQQEELMKNFNKNLQDNLEEFQNNEEKDPFKEDLKERLKENEKQLEEDEKLLKELEEMQEKINKEEFTEKLEELAKQNKNKKRSMKQLLELTKRYYVVKKAEKLQSQLEELAKEQERLSDAPKEENTPEAQERLNDKFKKIQKDLDELKKDNNSLQKPLNAPEDKLTEQRISEDQKQAKSKLEESQEAQEKQEKDAGEDAMKKAGQKQKAAAKKMKQMSKNLSQMMPSGGGASGGKQMAEDAEMLRQILDNLVLFSFDQENLIGVFRGIDIDNNQYGKYIVSQSDLRTHFEHVDDSLFALSLRQPKLSENVNKQISEVYFNIDKALDQLSENRIYQGVSAQQYTITAANELASFLSDVLDNMEQQMNMTMGSGSGEGEMQLPDIIMSQEQLNKEMQEGVEKGKDGQKPNGEQQGKEGQEGKEGNKSGSENQNKEGDSEGSEGKEGQKGKEGGEQGETGEKGNSKNSQGKDENGEKSGYGEGGSEELNEELYKIYKRQEQLRQALEDKIQQNSGPQTEIKNLIQQMEEVELDLLNSGFTNETLQKMNNLQHQLLKLENASFLQGEDDKRESKTNTKTFKTKQKALEKAMQYFNRTEILNRQALPLRDKYKIKVQDYFNKSND